MIWYGDGDGLHLAKKKSSVVEVKRPQSTATKTSPPFDSILIDFLLSGQHPYNATTIAISQSIIVIDFGVLCDFRCIIV